MQPSIERLRKQSLSHQEEGEGEKEDEEDDDDVDEKEAPMSLSFALPSIFSKTVTAAPTRRKRRRRRRERRIISTQRRRRRRRTTTSRKCSDSFTFGLLLNLFLIVGFLVRMFSRGKTPAGSPYSPSPSPRRPFRR